MKWSDPSRRAQELELVEFAVGPDIYAIPVEAVERILALSGGGADRITLEVRGEQLGVRRAEQLLGLDDGGSGEISRGIVVRSAGGRFVLAVERVAGVGPVERNAIAPTPPWFAGRTAALVRGVFPRDEHLIVILEPDSLKIEVEGEDHMVMARETEDG